MGTYSLVWLKTMKTSDVHHTAQIDVKVKINENKNRQADMNAG
jgi:hypothetical protein